MQYKLPICQKYFEHTENRNKYPINIQVHFFSSLKLHLLERYWKWGFESNKYLHGVQDSEDPTQDRIRRNPEINSNRDPGQENTEFTLLEKSSGVISSRRRT